MSQQTINNGEAGSSVRSKLNAMFGELYAGDFTNFISPPVTITQFVANTNNLVTGNGYTFNISSDADRNLTGITAGVDGQNIVFVNNGSFIITLKHQHSSSNAANRMLSSSGGDITLNPNEIVAGYYDGGIARWRMSGPVAPDLSAYALKALTVESTITTHYTLVLTDAGKYKRSTSNTDINITVPPFSSVAFSVGDQILLRAKGTGKMTFVPGASVTINPPFGGSLVSAGQGAAITLINVAVNEWDLLGQVDAD